MTIFFCHNCQQKRYCQVTNTASSKVIVIIICWITAKRPNCVSYLYLRRLKVSVASNGTFKGLSALINYIKSCFSQKWEIVRPGAVSPLRHVPDSIPRPPYVPNKKGNLRAWNGDGRPTQPEVTHFLLKPLVW